MSVPAGVERPTEVAELSRGAVEYRLERRGPGTVLMMHGGHMRASLPLGEEVFADAGYTVLAPSRPGYGRTPITTRTSPEGFAGWLPNCAPGSVSARWPRWWASRRAGRAR